MITKKSLNWFVHTFCIRDLISQAEDKSLWKIKSPKQNSTTKQNVQETYGSANEKSRSQKKRGFESGDLFQVRELMCGATNLNPCDKSNPQSKTQPPSQTYKKHMEVLMKIQDHRKNRGFESGDLFQVRELIDGVTNLLWH